MAYNPGGSQRGNGGPRFGGGGGGGRRFGGGGGFGGGRGGDRGSRGPMEMHQATCADCGKSCEVPFRPSGTKPVYCSNCFKSKDKDNGGGDFGGGSRDFERRDNGARRSYGDRDFSERPPMQMHEAVCSECGKDCEVPFKPSSEKPVYCNDCFDKVPKPERKGKTDGKPSADFNAKFEMLNIKLDRILKALDSSASHKSSKEVKEAVKEVKEMKTFEAPAKKVAKEAKAIPTETKSVIKKAKPKVKKAKI